MFRFGTEQLPSEPRQLIAELFNFLSQISDGVSRLCQLFNLRDYHNENITETY